MTKTQIAWIARLLLAAMVLLVIGASSVAAERTYRFTGVEIEARVLPDGSLSVTEDRTVEFRGRFFGMWQWINRHPGVEVTDVAIEADGVLFQRVTGEGEPGTFYVREDPDRTYIDWSYDLADRTTVFTIRYRLTGAVIAYDDVAELYCQFVGDQWEQGVDRVAITLLLPPGAAADEVYAWAHGPLHGKSEIVSGEQIGLEVSPLPGQQFVEGRFAFPPELVPGAVRKSGERLPDILAEEQKLAAAANRERWLAGMELVLAALILLGSVAAAVVTYLKYGREHRSSFDGDYYRELPGEYSPAELGVLWRFGVVGPDDLTATIVDLARRGHLQIEEFEGRARGLFGRQPRADYRLTRLPGDEPVREHERLLLNLLFEQVSTDGSVTFRELEQFARTRKVAFGRFWRDWQSQVKATAHQLDFFDQQTATARVVETTAGVLLFISGTAGLVFGLPVAGVAGIAGGIVLVVCSVLLRRRSHAGVDDFVKWRAFRRFLLHFSELGRHGLPSLVVWEHYLVYAITLGVAKQVLEQLQIVFPGLAEGSRSFGHGWFIYRGAGPSVTGITGGVDTLARSVSQSVRTATSSGSSGAGRGGGFSGGGGGGIGGGGGGVR